MKTKKGFTLIELLIVIAIIAILAAIAIPNFLAAQTRAKVSQVKSELKLIATALEAYKVDENVYPIDWDEAVLYPYYLNKCITTPVAYIPPSASSKGGRGILSDPFAIGRQGPLDVIATRYRYKNFVDNWSGKRWGIPDTAPGIVKGLAVFGAWRLSSRGPDRVTSVPPGWADGLNANDWLWTPYDPTNGTVSAGELMRSQREPEVTGLMYY